MDEQEAVEALSYTYPSSTFDIHSDGASGVIFSSWVSGEHPECPTPSGLQTVVDDWKLTQDYAKSYFDIVEFQSDLFNLLPSGLSTVELRLEFGALNTFALNKDFVGLSSYLQFLLDGNIATQDDINAVSDCVTKQGVIL